MQLQNRHGAQLEQLDSMRRELAAQEAQRAEEYAQQLQRLESLQKQLEEDHTEQQLTMRENAARVGAEDNCYNMACVVRDCSISAEA